MVPSPHNSGSSPCRSSTLPVNLEPRQKAAPPAPPSQMAHCLREQANEMTSTPHPDRHTAEAASVLAQASHHSISETLDHRGQQWPHGNNRGHTMGARVEVHLEARLGIIYPPGYNPHRDMPPIILNLVTNPQTLALAPQIALSVGERTPTVESPQSYYDDISIRSPTSLSTASELSELNWHSGPS